MEAKTSKINGAIVHVCLECLKLKKTPVFRSLESESMMKHYEDAHASKCTRPLLIVTPEPSKEDIEATLTAMGL